MEEARRPSGPPARRSNLLGAPMEPRARCKERAAGAGAPSRAWGRVMKRKAPATEGKRVARAWARRAGPVGAEAGDENARTRVLAPCGRRDPACPDPDAGTGSAALRGRGYATTIRLA